MPKHYPTKGALPLFLRAMGIAFSTVPVIVAVLTYFPLWQSRSSEAVVSGGALLLLVLALIPLIRIIRAKLRSPSVHTMWFIAFLVFYAFSHIAKEMTVIAFVGFIGNLMGAALFALARRLCDK